MDLIFILLGFGVMIFFIEWIKPKMPKVVEPCAKHVWVYNLNRKLVCSVCKRDPETKDN